MPEIKITEGEWNKLPSQPDAPPFEPVNLVALTMTPDAGLAFWKALIYAANRIPREARTGHAEMSHEDWLRWGASRLDAAIRAAASASETTEAQS